MVKHAVPVALPDLEGHSGKLTELFVPTCLSGYVSLCACCITFVGEHHSTQGRSESSHGHAEALHILLLFSQKEDQLQ